MTRISQFSDLSVAKNSSARIRLINHVALHRTCGSDSWSSRLRICRP